MSPADPVPGSAVSVLRARLVKLGAHPRLKLWPEAAATIREVIACVDELAACSTAASCDLSLINSRLAAIERCLASLVPRPDEFE